MEQLLEVAEKEGVIEVREDGKFHFPELTESLRNFVERSQKLSEAGKFGAEQKKRIQQRRVATATLKHGLSHPEAIREEKTRKDKNKRRGEREIPPPLDEDDLIEYAPGISMRPSERQELVDKVGERTVDFYIRQASEHLRTTGNTTFDGGATVRKWIRDDQFNRRGPFEIKNQNGREPDRRNDLARRPFKGIKLEKDLVNMATEKKELPDPP